MDFVRSVVDFFLHLDEHLNQIVTTYGVWTHLILFAIVFAETGLVVTPFLPGDSLLFAAGTFAALGSLDLWLLVVLLIGAAILGDTRELLGRAPGSDPGRSAATCGFCGRTTSTAPAPSTRSTGARRSSLPGSSRSSGRSLRSWPG